MTTRTKPLPISMKLIAPTLATLGLVLGSASCSPDGVSSRTAAEFAAPPGSNASIVSSSVPTTMAPGERRNVTVVMRNTGSASPANDWDSDYALFRTGGLPFANRPVSGTVTAVPQQDATFRFVVQAPTSGSASVSYRMYSSISGSTGFFGASGTDNITIDAMEQPDYDCTFVSSTVPASFTPGQIQNVDITVQNTGSQDWAANDFCLYSTDSPVTEWGSQTCRQNTTTVTAGSNHTFTVRVTAPASTGSFTIQRQMYDLRSIDNGGIGFFDTASDCVSIATNVTGTPALDADFVTASSTLDDNTAWQPSESRVVTVTMTNTGSQTWLAADDYYLYSRNTPTNLWSSNAAIAQLQSDVAPGGSATFSFTLTAPAVSGNYTSNWQLYSSSVGTFFGDQTGVAVNVDPSNSRAYDATVVSQNIPSVATQLRSATFEVTMQNSGTQAWSGSDFRLTSQNSPSSLWGIVNIPLGSAETIAPGASKTFSFQVQAPFAGSYSSEWSMNWSVTAGGVGDFGATASSAVTVTNPCGNGIFDGGEECDDGNQVDGDACSNACLINPQTVTVNPGSPAGRTFYGESGSRDFGNVAIGDVDGDGVNEVLMGGRAYVVAADDPRLREFGGAVYGYEGGSGFFDGTASNVASAPSFRFIGARAGDAVGFGEEGAFKIGDVTGDGTADILISAPNGACSDGTGNCGRVYVVQGGSGLTTAGTVDLRVLGGPVIAVLVAPNDGDKAVVTAVGDLTGDGTDDIVVGMPFRDNGATTDAGAVAVVAGGTLTGTITLSGGNIVSEIVSGVANARLGTRAAIGQLNDAGNADLLVAAPAYTSATGGSRAGGAWALFSPLAGTIDLDATPRQWSARWRGAGIRDTLGTAVAVANVTGASSQDVLLGVGGQRFGGSRFGSVDIIAGPIADGTDSDYSASGVVNIRIQGRESFDSTGWCLATLDFNADGRNDIVTGGPFATGAGNAFTQAGEANLISGLNLTSGQIGGSTPYTLQGGETVGRMCFFNTMVAAGDLDGDGKDDFCVGSMDANTTGSGLVQPGRVDCVRSPF